MCEGDQETLDIIWCVRVIRRPSISVCEKRKRRVREEKEKRKRREKGVKDKRKERKENCVLG